jgi:hypothetical protein
MIKMTSPLDVLRAIMVPVVIRGSNSVIATIVEINTKIEVKNSVILA